MLTKHTSVMINDDLLERLLVALHPIILDEDSNGWHVGYFCAQENFKRILTMHLNKGPLAEPKTIPETPPSAPTSGRRWWKR